MMSKTCTKCGLEKALEEFNVASNALMGGDQNAKLVENRDLKNTTSQTLMKLSRELRYIQKS